MKPNLAAPIENARVPGSPGITAPEPEYDVAAPPFAHHLWVLRRQSWKILAFVTACELAALIVSSRITPVYESTAVVDIDRQAPSGVIGEEANRASGNDSDQFMATQIQLIEADEVLRPVAQKYNLLEREQQYQELLRSNASK